MQAATSPDNAPHDADVQTVHPVLADVLEEEEPETIAWVKG